MNRTNANHKSNQSNPTSPAYQQVNNNRSNQGNTMARALDDFLDGPRCDG